MRFFACLFLLLSCLTARAALPEVVMAQLKSDVRSAIIGLAPKGYTPPVEEVDETLRTVLTELNSEQSLFELTPTDLVDFRKDSTELTIPEITRVMNALKKGVHNKPLPHLLAFYDNLRDDNALSPRQKILCYRLTLRIAAMSGVEIPPAPAPSPAPAAKP